MKTIKEYLIKEDFANNLHDNMNELEILLTTKLAGLIGENNIVRISVDGSEINFLNRDEADNEGETELYSAAGVLIENYIIHLLNEKINLENYLSTDGFFINQIKDLDNGTYNNYDLEVGDMRFEIKTFHKFATSGISISKKQQSSIGPDAFIVMVEVGVSQNNIMIKDVIVRQYGNLKTVSKKIVGVK